MFIAESYAFVATLFVVRLGEQLVGAVTSFE